MRVIYYVCLAVGIYYACVVCARLSRPLLYSCIPSRCFQSEWAVICYTCYIALQQQFKEYEKMHLPEKFRKYNWRQIPLEQTLPLQKEERRMRKVITNQGYWTKTRTRRQEEEETGKRGRIKITTS